MEYNRNYISENLYKYAIYEQITEIAHEKMCFINNDEVNIKKDLFI
jgi:hypothetical protein